MQLDTLFAPPVVPSRAKKQPLRNRRWMIRLNEVEANRSETRLSLPQPQLQMASFEYLQILYLKTTATEDGLWIAYSVRLHSFKICHQLRSDLIKMNHSIHFHCSADVFLVHLLLNNAFECSAEFCQ